MSSIIGFIFYFLITINKHKKEPIRNCNQFEISEINLSSQNKQIPNLTGINTYLMLKYI